MYYTPLTVNLARGKLVNAIHGDYIGSLDGSHCMKTKPSVGSWLQVDLEAVYDIKLMVLLNRRGCCGELK